MNALFFTLKVKILSSVMLYKKKKRQNYAITRPTEEKIATKNVLFSFSNNAHTDVNEWITK